MGELTEMTFYTDLEYEGFLRWFIMFADHAEILEPASLRDDAVRLAEKISSKIKVSARC